MKKILLIGILLTATVVKAQTVTAPTAATFTQADADFAASASFFLEFFQCASLSTTTPQTCVGQAAAPFQTGVTIPKANVTSVSPTRTFSLTIAPPNGLLASMPLGVPFVATVVANGDPAQGATNSARSVPSNPFFQGLRVLAAVTTLTLK